MLTNKTLHTFSIIIMLFVIMLTTIASNRVTAADRIFDLHIINGTDAPVTWIIHGYSCYQGTPADGGILGPIQAGGQVTMVIARDQLSDCDGENGYFSLEPSGAAYHNELQHMNFNNAGGLYLSDITTRYTGQLSIKNPVDESYTWTMRETNARLVTPPDERLTRPRNYVAYDSGYWGEVSNGTTRLDILRFEKQAEPWGSYFETCFGQPLFHPQHIKRLPNKDGRAYFMGAQSYAHNGYIYLMETYPDMLDSVTDQVIPPTDGSPVGKIIWQELFLGSFNGNNNPIGNWNHPAKMAIQGGVLVVVAQNWSEGLGLDGLGCVNSTSNPYQRGDSEDALLFYDIRDPQHPVYWGKMTATDLKLPELEYCNGTDGSGRGGDARQIAVVSLTHTPDTNEYILNAGIHLDKCNEKGDYYSTWKTETISPIIEDWQLIGGQGTDPYVPFIYTSGEHGDDFNSYQLDNVRNTTTNPANGVERQMTFIAGDSDEDAWWQGEGVSFEIAEVGGPAEIFTYRAADGSVHWVSESFYITRKGVPIIYTLENAAAPDGGRNNRDAYVHQVSDSRNSAALQLNTYPPNQVVDSLADDGPGTLRNAIRAGGKITFSPTFTNNPVIELTSGPLYVYLYDVDIDASALPTGITISGGNTSRVIEITAGMTVNLKGITIKNGFTESIGGGILNQGILNLYNSTVSNNNAYLGGGGIANVSGRLVMENCTVANNNIVQGTLYGGGGILNRGNGLQRLIIRHCTIVNNKSDAANPYHSGGIESLGNRLTMIIKNSIIANNLNYQDIPSDLRGAYSSIGVNIIESDNGAAHNGPAPLRVDPQLGSLRDNGGPTETMRPLRGSPVIDAALTTSDPQAADQRGFPRPIGTNPDVGAVERLITNRIPAFQQQMVALQGATLSWSGASGAAFQVYFDNGSGSMQPYGPQINGSLIGLGTLTPNTEYAWRVDTILNGKTYTGDIWLFTTRGALVVTTLVDENDAGLGQGAGDSLREAVAAALPDETITFAAELAGQTIVLSGTQIDIDKNLTIDASTLPDGITISANNQSRIFAITNAQTVVLQKLTLTGGNSSFGGALINTGSTLSLLNSNLIGNTTPDNGGGIYNWDGGSLLVENSTVSGNQATAGGGIYFNGESGGTLTIYRSTLLNNRANFGGALFITGGTNLIENATLTQNSSLTDQGGGVWSQGNATLTLRHTTVVKNVGVGLINNSSAALFLDNAIVATNFNLANSEADISGNYTAVGANLIQSVAGSKLGGPTPIDEDPELAPIGFYGGRTQTMPPLAGSPVIDAGVPTANTPSSDQRGGGYPRPNGTSPDIDLGAIESTLVSNADLKSLTTSAGLLSPAFLPGTTSYVVTTTVSTTSAAIKAEGRIGDEVLKYQVNGSGLSVLNPNVASAVFPLNIGMNTVEVEVSAQNGVTVKSYILSIIREGIDPTLAALITNSGTISPAFDPATAVYNMTVANGQATIQLMATTADSQATIALSDDFGALEYAVISGNLSPALPLKVGANRFNIKVTARDGETTAVYTLIVHRQAVAAAMADLSNLTMSNGLLSPSFSSGLTFYTAGVETTSMTVSPTAARAGATIKVRVNGGAFTTVSSGAVSPALNLNGGANVIEVQVTAEDGTTVKSYKLIVTRYVTSVYWASKLGDGASINPAISSDGRFVAFSSYAENLLAGDNNGYSDIFVYDIASETVELVSISNDEVQGDNDSTNPAISADGRYVTFQSKATTLVPGDTNDNNDPDSFGEDIFVYDRQTDTIERVSLTDSGGQGNGNSQNPSISGDGRYVAFSSRAQNLVSGFANGEVDIYIYDRIADEIVGISTPFNVIANREADNPVISADGQFVAFEFSVNKALENGNDGYQYTSIYLYERGAKNPLRIIEGNDGVDANGTISKLASISADGRYVVFQSNMNTLDFYDNNGELDVFVYDSETKLTYRVSTNAQGVEGTLGSQNPAISGDGRLISFDSADSTLTIGDGNGFGDIFMKDRANGSIRILSSNEAEVQANGDSSFPSVDFYGNSVAFQSLATNLDPLDNTNDDSDIYVVTNGATAESFVADLTLLNTSADPLTPSFSAGIYAYSASVPNETATLLLNATTAAAEAAIQIRIGSDPFTPLDSGTTSVPLSLEVGTNTVEVKVTAPNGSINQLYTLTINRAQSSDANLSSLVLFDKAFVILSPNFASGTVAYTTVVSKDSAILTVVPVSTHTAATIKVNGSTVASGDNSNPLDLSFGANAITVQVTAEDGSTVKSYTIVVTRAANTRPVANGRVSFVLPDSNNSITLTGNDSDGDLLTYIVVTQPTNGTLSGTAPFLIYSPTTGFVGNDSFTFKVNDGTIDSLAATVSIGVGTDVIPTIEQLIYLPLVVH